MFKLKFDHSLKPMLADLTQKSKTELSFLIARTFLAHTWLRLHKLSNRSVTVVKASVKFLARDWSQKKNLQLDKLVLCQLKSILVVFSDELVQ